MTPHTLEVAFLIVATLAFGASCVIFCLKAGDLRKVRRAKHNGPIQFVTIDNLRRQGFTMAVSAWLLMAAVSSVHNTVDPITAQARNLLTTGLIVAMAITAEAGFIYRRRERLAELLATYEGRPGGRRASDPPLGEPISE